MGYETDNPLHGRTLQSLGPVRENSGRIQRRRSRGHRRGMFGGRHRQRRRRIDSRARALLRHLRIQAHTGPHAFNRPPTRLPRAVLADRRGGTDGADDRRSAAARSGGSRLGRRRIRWRCRRTRRQKAEGRRSRRRHPRVADASSKTTDSVPVTAETRAAVRSAARAAADSRLRGGGVSSAHVGPDAVLSGTCFFAEVGLLALNDELGGAERDLPILGAYGEQAPGSAVRPHCRPATSPTPGSPATRRAPTTRSRSARGGC